jgi:hypothetical protein
MEDVIMKTVKFNAVMASMLSAGALLLSVPVVSNAEPGQGWDAFNTGASNEGVGERIPTGSQAYMGTSLESSAGQGWDAFKSGASNEGVGQVIPASDKPYLGTSMEAAPSGGSDAFRVGGEG